MSYANGKLPASALAVVYQNPKQHLRAGQVSTSFKRLSQRSFVKGYGFIRVADAYRSYDEQVKVFLSVYEQRSVGVGPYNDVRWWQGRRYVRVRGAGTVAVPGTSNHGLGLSVDLMEPYASNGPKHSWFVARLAFYGWYWEGAQFGEPWHYTWKGFPPRPTLRNGSKGDPTVAWQTVLRFDLGLRAVDMKIDGIFGPTTKKYTQQWQRKFGLTADGIVGKNTWTKAGLA